ncbi:thrombospondin type-1 domain-containing protein 4-like [Dioscorea cayenensis subsp. rotundata]|uniref:Thrombospondin type-1 domain-containing protein 4-like n=1 Tax=Dioscorea cayennensis subsp. rotundata TaxID=55577 RepID=A0AB40BAD3_DIOCR|nr:thrombospondin type-1 domain-containing protein 4-like [Dioscorea cayenensis subsp. rotundata]
MRSRVQSGWEMASRSQWPLLALALIALVFPFSALSSVDLVDHGCYWTESCQSKWFGGCGAGHVIADQSGDCKGLCREPTYAPCLPFHTYFHCCKPERPRATDRCSSCDNKIDFGDEYICCTDCSEPYLIDNKSKLGYCKTGAELAMQLKPQEIFKWIAGPWMKCSSPCDGGIRYRDVGCFGSMEDMSIKHYAVDDSRCSVEDMPARQESCNLMSCGDFSNNDLDDNEHSGMTKWLVAFFVLVGLVAVGGLGFAGYTYYQRKTSTPSGFVYIMLEGYS